MQDAIVCHEGGAGLSDSFSPSVKKREHSERKCKVGGDPSKSLCTRVEIISISLDYNWSRPEKTSFGVWDRVRDYETVFPVFLGPPKHSPTFADTVYMLSLGTRHLGAKSRWQTSFDFREPGAWMPPGCRNGWLLFSLTSKEMFYHAFQPAGKRQFVVRYSAQH